MSSSDCPVCEGPVGRQGRGRPKLYCSATCRRDLFEWRRLEEAKRSWIQVWRTVPGDGAKRAIERLERELAIVERLRRDSESESS